MTTLLIIGAGGHGKVVADAALATSLWDDIVFLDDAWPDKQTNGPWAIHGKVDQLTDWKGLCTHAVVAIGNNHLRMALQSKLIATGFVMATIIHPSAQVSRFARLGAGCVVFANAVVNVDAEVGDAAIINTAATIDHDCRLGKGVHVAPGANIGGGVIVGDCSWIGIGAAIRHYTQIGANVTVDAGAVVMSDILDGVTAAGNPARSINK